MKRSNILLSQAFRLVRASNPMGTVYIRDAVNFLQERYRFIDVPTTLDEYDETKGITFRHGKFELGRRGGERSVVSEIVIDSFKIYGNGVLAESRGTVEDTDLFLDDVIDAAVQQFGIQIYPGTQKGFMSQLEVELDRSFAHLFDKVNGLGRTITSLLETNDKALPPFEVNGFSMHCDTLNLQPLIPTVFSIERRSGFAYSSNTYLSTAPIKTGDHIDLLKQLESISVKK